MTAKYLYTLTHGLYTVTERAEAQLMANGKLGTCFYSHTALFLCSLLLFHTYKGVWGTKKIKSELRFAFGGESASRASIGNYRNPVGYAFVLSDTNEPVLQAHPHPQLPPTAWGPTADPSPLTFLIGVVVKGPSVEDTPPLLPLRPEKAVL